MQAARAKVFAATKASKIFFLNTMNANDVVDMIKEGVMIGPASQQAAEIGRRVLEADDALVESAPDHHTITPPLPSRLAR